jgi:hypothetical protein
MRLLCLLLLALTACDPEPVGLRCDLGQPAREGETVIASGSLDCTSRLCLRPAGSTTTGGDTIGMCTDACVSDDDCVGDPTTPCSGGFTCAVPTAVGPFGCQTMCVCRDDLISDTPPAACE